MVAQSPGVGVALAGTIALMIVLGIRAQFLGVGVPKPASTPGVANGQMDQPFPIRVLKK
jgi:hypothetical protein